MRVIELTPGDKIVGVGPEGKRTATFLAQTKHPMYPGLQLVIWWLHEEGTWSFDALSPVQYVGKLETLLGTCTHEQRQENLRTILHSIPQQS